MAMTDFLIYNLFLLILSEMLSSFAHNSCQLFDFWILLINLILDLIVQPIELIFSNDLDGSKIVLHRLSACQISHNCGSIWIRFFHLLLRLC